MPRCDVKHTTTRPDRSVAMREWGKAPEEKSGEVGGTPRPLGAGPAGPLRSLFVIILFRDFNPGLVAGAFVCISAAERAAALSVSRDRDRQPLHLPLGPSMFDLHVEP
jgi:hypothetical protein